MNPWRLIIEQVEAGYSMYKWKFVWGSPDKCPTEPTQTDGGRYTTVMEAESAARAYYRIRTLGYK